MRAHAEHALAGGVIAASHSRYRAPPRQPAHQYAVSPYWPCVQRGEGGGGGQSCALYHTRTLARAPPARPYHALLLAPALVALLAQQLILRLLLLLLPLLVIVIIVVIRIAVHIVLRGRGGAHARALAGQHHHEPRPAPLAPNLPPPPPTHTHTRALAWLDTSLPCRSLCLRLPSQKAPPLFTSYRKCLRQKTNFSTVRFTAGTLAVRGSAALVFPSEHSTCSSSSCARGAAAGGERPTAPPSRAAPAARACPSARP